MRSGQGTDPRPRPGGALRLEDLRPGARGRVVAHRGGSRAYTRRLLAMGLVPGSEFRVVRRAPLGDPVELEVLGSLLSVRAREAAGLEVEVVAP
ncbi:MAG: ferrous iron transport protein A [Solirubrobacteraceae bacterium]|nr:ferrous iron transport protein A [Solirubrobacteraceae bacterium]